MWARRRIVVVTCCVAAVWTLPGCGAAAPPVAGSAPSASSVPSAGVRADGRGRTATGSVVRHAGVFFHAGSAHYCSGGLLSTATADLVVTAAHCVAPAGAGAYGDLEFAPAYGHGTAPYGRWKAVRITVDPRWADGGDPDLDVAFVELAPRAGRRVSDVVGADRIGFGPAAGATIRLTGYPDGAPDAVTCLGTPTRPSAGQLRVACTGYPAGTSGSPWLAGWDPATGTGTVVGVIGGYQQGGDTPDVSYSSYFGDDVRQLYLRAAGSR